MVRIGDHTSSTLVLNTGMPQGRVLSPTLFIIFTHNCTPNHASDNIVKFADDTTVVGHLAQWCSDNKLVLNATKTKEVILDYKTTRRTAHALLSMHWELKVMWYISCTAQDRRDLAWVVKTAQRIVGSLLKSGLHACRPPPEENLQTPPT